MGANINSSSVILKQIKNESLLKHTEQHLFRFYVSSLLNSNRKSVQREKRADTGSEKIGYCKQKTDETLICFFNYVKDVQHESNNFNNNYNNYFRVKAFLNLLLFWQSASTGAIGSPGKQCIPI